MSARVPPVMITVAACALALSGCSVLIDGGAERMTSFSIHYDIEPDGTVHATETIDWNFGDREDPHGIERVLNSRFAVDASTDRVYPYSGLTVSSPTDASALVSTALDNSYRIRVGNANDTTDARERYVLEYDIAGVLNTVQQPDGLVVQQLYWNATGDRWGVELSNISVTVEAPASPTGGTCFAGIAGATTPCTAVSTSNDRALFSHRRLAPSEGLTIVVDWPVGTFTSTQPILDAPLAPGTPPILEGSNDGPDPFAHPVNWGTGLALLLGIPAFFLGLVVARRRDSMFAAITPGEIPAHAETAPVIRAPYRQTIVARYEPPIGFPVGAANRVLRKSKRRADVTATLVDLAVRGYVRIEEIGGRTGRRARDYRLVATPERAEIKKRMARPGTPNSQDLVAHESLLLSALFAGGRASVSLSNLTNTFAPSLRAVNASTDSFVSTNRYFRDKLGATNPLLVMGMVTAVAGFFGLIVLDLERFILIPIGLGAGCAIAITLSARAARRTALGHAVYLQLAGFQRYIETAEADRIRFDETEDIFSRYMPWAIAFGQAEHWARVFAQLAAEGRNVSHPDWYVGTSSTLTGGAFGAAASLSSIGDAVSSFTMAATSSFSSTPSSSGSSGSGGGGSSGGGGGGGGGGGW